MTSLDHIRRVLAEGLTGFPLYLANEHACQELLYPPILSSTYTTQPRFKSQNQFKNAGIQLCSPQNFEGKSLTVIFHDLIINNKSESLELWEINTTTVKTQVRNKPSFGNTFPTRMNL